MTRVQRMLREKHLCKSIFKQTLISQKSVQVSQWLNCINGPNSSLSLYPCSLSWDFTVPFTRVALRQNDNMSVLSLFIRSLTCFSHLHLLPWQCHECPNWPSCLWETWNKAKSPQSSQPAPKNVREPLRFGDCLLCSKNECFPFWKPVHLQSFNNSTQWLTWILKGYK